MAVTWPHGRTASMAVTQPQVHGAGVQATLAGVQAAPAGVGAHGGHGGRGMRRQIIFRPRSGRQGPGCRDHGPGPGHRARAAGPRPQAVPCCMPRRRKHRARAESYADADAAIARKTSGHGSRLPHASERTHDYSARAGGGHGSNHVAARGGQALPAIGVGRVCKPFHPSAEHA